jgi:Second Messenger Oligonucleotide or Dinucleotide Synthetase domain
MELPSYFIDFLSNIRPTDNQVDDYIRGHSTLTKRLWADPVLAPIIVAIILQGSYRRATAVRPKSGKRADVDVIVVTKLSQQDYPNPEDALKVFIPFLEKYYLGKYELQGRSVGITLSYVDLDLVITSAPSESEIGILKSDSVTSQDTPEDVNDWRLVPSWISLESRSTMSTRLMQSRLNAAEREAEWKLSPLYIPDRDAKIWVPTHPLAQIQWTWDKNRLCNGHYINVVKALKWWRRVNHPTPKYPKGYPVEHLIGQCCPDGISSVAEGVTTTLETIVSNYQVHAALKTAPDLRDHGVPTHDVFKRVSGEDFAEFHSQVYAAAKVARDAIDADTVYESSENWRILFGKEFPKAPDDNNGRTLGLNPGGFTQRNNVSILGGGRFA